MQSLDDVNAAPERVSLREQYLPRHSRRSITIIALCFLFLSVFGSLLTLTPSSPAYDLDRGLSTISGLIFSVATLLFIRANRMHAAVYCICLLLIVAQVIYQWKVGLGIRSPATGLTLLLVPLAGLLLGSRSAKVALVASILWVVGLTAAEWAGVIPGFTVGNAPLLLPSLFIELVLVASQYQLTERYLKAVEGAVNDMTQEQLARFKAESNAIKAQASAQYKDKFMAMLSHEIRTPLNGVSSSMQLMWHPKATQEMRDRAQRAMQQSIDSVNEVLNDLLENSKIEAGKLELRRQPMLLVDFLSTIESVHCLQAELRNLKFEIKYASLPTTPVLIDAPRLRQMLNNLVSNALKFTTHGSITLEVATLDSQTIRFSVIDTGCGMSKEDAAMLFKEYAQLRNAGFETTGTGLGLTVVKKLALLMGGDAGVTSEPGHGSTFWFDIKI